MWRKSQVRGQEQVQQEAHDLVSKKRSRLASDNEYMCLDTSRQPMRL
jgi:hypothetical protein